MKFNIKEIKKTDKYISRYYLIMLTISILLTAFAAYIMMLTNVEQLYVVPTFASVDLLGMLICDILLVSYIVENRHNDRARTLFRLIAVCTWALFFDIYAGLSDGHVELGARTAKTYIVFFILSDLFVLCYWLYLKKELKLTEKKYIMLDKFLKLCVVGGAVASILNWWFCYYFYINDYGYFTINTLYAMRYLVSGIIFLFCIGIVFVHKMPIREKMVLFSFEIFPLLAICMESMNLGTSLVYPAYLMSIILIYVNVYLSKNQRKAEEEAFLTKQNNAAAKSQLQPEFVYNTIASIKAACDENPAQAKEMLTSFEEYMHTNLGALSTVEAVPFNKELEHIKNYLQIEQHRLGDRLQVDYDVDDLAMLVPPLSIQSMVENSIRHGLSETTSAPLKLKLLTKNTAAGHMIVIEDDGAGFDTGKLEKSDLSHAGIDNAKNRLKDMCGATIEITSTPGNGCRTVILIPLT